MIFDKTRLLVPSETRDLPDLFFPCLDAAARRWMLFREACRAGENGWRVDIDFGTRGWNAEEVARRQSQPQQIGTVLIGQKGEARYDALERALSSIDVPHRGADFEDPSPWGLNLHRHQPPSSSMSRNGPPAFLLARGPSPIDERHVIFEECGDRLNRLTNGETESIPSGVGTVFFARSEDSLGQVTLREDALLVFDGWSARDPHALLAACHQKAGKRVLWSCPPSSRNGELPWSDEKWVGLAEDLLVRHAPSKLSYWRFVRFLGERGLSPTDEAYAGHHLRERNRDLLENIVP